MSDMSAIQIVRDEQAVRGFPDMYPLFPGIIRTFAKILRVILLTVEKAVQVSCSGKLGIRTRNRQNM